MALNEHGPIGFPLDHETAQSALDQMTRGARGAFSREDPLSRMTRGFGEPARFDPVSALRRLSGAVREGPRAAVRRLGEVLGVEANSRTALR